MSTYTLVSVHEVDATGATGSRVGSGSLVHPLLVLLHPPLSGQLADRGDVATRLRLAIGSFDDTHSVVEVIDVQGVHVAETSGDDPLIAVSLARAASSSPMPLVGVTADADRDFLVDAIRQHLAQAPTPVDVRSEDELGGAASDWSTWPCRIFHPPPRWCFQPEPDTEALPCPGSE